MIWKILIVILILVAIALGVFLFIGNRMLRKQREQQAQLESTAQVVSMLIIDKKRLKLSESGLPQAVIDQAPKYMRRSKLPVVKAKIGPKIMVLISDPNVFELIPVKKECKVSLSGIYITEIKSARGGLETPPPKKKGFFARFKK